MPQVRCPLCSYLNPTEAEVCSFCGARLKPLRPASGELTGVPAGENKPEDENDWLRSLQGDQGEPDETPAEEPQSDEDMPDWLSRIRSKAQNDVEGEDQQVDWMQDLGGEDEAAEESSPDDWLSRLENTSDAEQPPQPPSEEPAADLPDWLQDVSGDSGTQTSGPDMSFEPSQASDEEDFSWLGGEPQPEQTAETGTGFGLTGFLSSIQSPTEPEAGAPDSGETPPSEDSSDADLPAWLSADAETPSADAGAESAAEASGTDIPDWLSGADFEAGEEEAPQPEPEPSDVTPSWLSVLGESSDAQEASEGEDVELPGASEAGGLPAWMTAGEDMSAAEEPAAVEDTTPSGESLEGEGLPDWMTGFEAPAPEQPEPPDIPEPTPLSAEDLPDFAALASSSELEEDSIITGLPEETGAPQEEVPDWLQGFNAQEPADAAVPPLFGMEGAMESPVSGEEDQPFAVDLPEWLSEDTPREPGQESPETAEPVGEELAQAELPDWVKEMRPIESIIPGEADLADIEHHAEKAGPLAGLAGILPAEEMAARYRRPPVYSAKLRVSEKQRGQATQFENLIAQETQPLLVPTHARSAQGAWLRVLIALLLIFVLALPRLVALEPLAVPTLSPDETMRMFDHIEGGLSVDSPVLLAVDFDPALWGEMKLASQPVIDHLMAREARIVIVSTRPTGPALAEQLLSDAVAVRVGYNLGEKTENLGYLPGDMISLLEFAHQPAFAAPANLAGELAWERTSLRGIATMQDFSSVVVLTDTAETGRAWVEQVKPEMGDVPLLMVTSAQAAPMMAPFIESGQVDGMVSGLLGGVLYSQWTRQEGPGQAYLASYQVGVLLALALALGGGLISGAVALLNRGKVED